MNVPLSEIMRPIHLEEVVGQPHLTGEEGFLQKIIEAQTPLSIILWGPPGTGKTTLAKLYAKAFNMPIESVSAVSSQISDIKKLITNYQHNPLFKKKFVLFIDEIHRFNKAQQDIFLPYLEKGAFILVGATTENPSFYLNNALLSRVRVLEVRSLEENALDSMLKRYESLYEPLPLQESARQLLLQYAAGDGRYLLNLVENIVALKITQPLDKESLKKLIQKNPPLYDQHSEAHFNLISALHKSVRGSDPDASLYWFSRMIAGGESPRYIGRRMIRMASEDIGLADPEALKITLNAFEAYQILGSPEGELALAEAVIYLALAPKSNAIYTALKKSMHIANKTAYLNPPKTILNAPTQLMKNQGYGEGYCYDHDTPLGFSGQNYFPEKLNRYNFYEPKNLGFEREMLKRKNYFEELRKKFEKQEKVKENAC